MRRRLPPILCLALVATAAGVALAQVGGPPRARAAAVAAAGAFEISDSGAGEPIFAAAGIAPGEAARGTVAIEDTGSEPVALTLHRGELVDEPGLGGGLLSGRLELTVVDVSEPSAPRTIYAGPLDAMPDQAAGDLEPGETGTFEFTATLPDAGAPGFQNAVQGASTTVAYDWIAAEVGKGGGEGGEGGGAPGVNGLGGGPDYTPSGASGVSGAGAGLELSVRKIQPRPRRGRIVAWTRCDQTCRVSVRGRISARNDLGLHRVAKVRFARKGFYAPGSHRLRIPIPPGMRQWLAHAPGRKRLRVRLRFVALGTGGQRDVVTRTVMLRPR